MKVLTRRPRLRHQMALIKQTFSGILRLSILDQSPSPASGLSQSPASVSQPPETQPAFLNVWTVIFVTLPWFFIVFLIYCVLEKLIFIFICFFFFLFVFLSFFFSFYLFLLHFSCVHAFFMFTRFHISPTKARTVPRSFRNSDWSFFWQRLALH